MCRCRPTGRVSGLKNHTVWVRIPPSVPTILIMKNLKKTPKQTEKYKYSNGIPWSVWGSYKNDKTAVANYLFNQKESKRERKNLAKLWKQIQK